MLLFLKGLFLFLKGVFLFSSVFEVFVLFQKFRCKFCFYFWGIKKCQMYRIRNTKFNKIAQGGGAQTTLGVGWKFKIFVKLCYFCTFLKFVLKNLVPLHLWGYLTFRILSLLRYVVDIIKSSLNPFFLNPMKTDIRKASQSSTAGLFLCFWTTSWKIAKNCTYMVKADFFVIET